MAYISGPVNALTDYQMEYDGFLMGAGTSFGLPPLWEFLDLAPLKTMDEARDWADGSHTGPDFADILTPSIDVEITGPGSAAFAANVVAFRNQFTIGDARALWVKLPGMPVFGINAKVNKRSIPIDQTWEQLAVATLQWRMTDPVWQSATRSTALAASGSALSGLMFPLGVGSDGRYYSNFNREFDQNVNGANCWAGTGTAAMALNSGAGSDGEGGFARTTWSVATTTKTGGAFWSSIPIVALNQYTFSMYVRPSIAQVIVPQVQFYAGATPTASTSGSPISCPANVWTRIMFTATSAAGDTVADWRAYATDATSSLWSVGSTFDIDSGQVDFGAVALPFSPVGVLDFNSTLTASSGAILTNAGNADAWPYVVVTGPCPGGFTVVLDGNIVTYDDDVPSAALVIVDYRSGTAQLVNSGGSVDRTYVLSVRDFSPVPGLSSSSLQFIFSASSGSAVVSIADMWR